MEFLTIETKDKVKGIVFFFEGRNGNCFYDVLLSEDCEACCHQLGLMKFFEREYANRLHFLGDHESSPCLLNLGFTQREQYHISVRKTEE